MFSKAFRSFSMSKQIAYLAIFIALSVAANSVLGVELSASNKIAFTYTVSFLAGYLLGPVPAFLVGFIGDAIGFLISPVDVYWLYGLTLGLFGFLTGWIMNGIRREDAGWLFGKAILAFAVGFIVITCFLNTLVQYSYAYIFLWGGTAQKTFWVYLAGRLSIQSIVYVVNVALCLAALPFCAKFKRKY